MIKKLDLLILRAFIGPFIATFFISLFVLVMQFFWLYIDDLVGKNVETSTLLYLIGIVAITWVPLALPLALLLSSIMTFGNLGETFEIVAIKSAGIPLLRFMRPLLIVTIFLSAVAFLFANNVIPFAQLKFESLKHDIIISKPAFDIKEGVFYNKIDGYIIKLGKKEKDDSTIRNILIYERNNGTQDNVLIAESGIMRISKDTRFLEFILKKGWRYQGKGNINTTNSEFIRMGFESYKKIFDLSTFALNKTQENAFQYDPKMLSIRQLTSAIDSLKKFSNGSSKKTALEVGSYFPFLQYADSNWEKIPPMSEKQSLALKKESEVSKVLMINSVENDIRSARNTLILLEQEYKAKAESLRLHQIEWQRKFTLSVACIVLFLIGAPLGSIIRKGGLGTPLVFAIVFFVLFHLLNTFGEKFAKEDVLSPFVGMWLSTFLLIPIGAFLTFKVMQDSQLFNSEAYYKIFKRIRILVTNFKHSKHLK